MSQSIGNKPNPPLVVKEITDIYVRNNFFELSKYFENQNQFLNFKFIEFKTDSAVSNLKVPHGLGFLPKDIVRAKVTGTGICTFNHSLFDKQLLDVSTTGPVRVRCFVGTHFRDASQVNPTETDSEDFFSKFPTIPGKNGAIKFIEQSLGYEVQATDDTIFVKSSNGVSPVPITLPDAKLNSGRQVTLIKNDDDFLQHTISGTNNQTIDGETSKTLTSFRERWVLLSNGTNWTVLVHDYPREWRSPSYAIPSAITSLGTVSLTHYQWRREGDRIHFKWTFRAGTVAGTIADVRLPANIRIDTAKLSANARGYNLGLAFHVTSLASNPLWSGNNAFALFYDNTSTDRLFFANAGATNAFTKLVGTGVSTTSGDMFLEIAMAVQGWRG